MHSFLKLNFLKILFITFFIFQLTTNISFAEIPPDIKKIITRGKLIVAINGIDYPPFFYHTADNKFEGIDIDIAKDLAKYLDVNVEFNRSAKTFAEVIKLVENEKADIAISALSGTLTRGILVRVSDPYLIPNQVVIINRILELKISNNINISKNLVNQESLLWNPKIQEEKVSQFGVINLRYDYKFKYKLIQEFTDLVNSVLNIKKINIY